jgi:uncharacterized membrane protein YtjA (UPF0391 family)
MTCKNGAEPFSPVGERRAPGVVVRGTTIATSRRLFDDVGIAMLHYAVVFLVIALIAAVLGFGGIAAGAASIAKILFVVFLILFVVSLVFGRTRRG